ncbi:MAG: hypothetical protein AAB955_00765 [Patescibacteria group bacterium]
MPEQFEVGGGDVNPVIEAMELDGEDEEAGHNPKLSRDDWKRIGVALTVLAAVGVLISRISL